VSVGYHRPCRVAGGGKIPTQSYSVGEKKQRIIVITGPTASGKSSLAIELAQRFDGEIVNIDSMQVYRGMDVGTAKPSLEERKEIPHHLIDVVDPDEEFNAAVYRSLAIPALREMDSRGKKCFVVGGTGLYIKTLLGGLLACPPPSEVLRENLRQQWEQHGPQFLHRQLGRLDPETSRRIHPHDKTRILRALEIMTLGQEPLSELITRHAFREEPFRALKICLQIDREDLYHRIDQRSLAMVEKGLIQETEALLARGYSGNLKSMKSLGYRHAMGYLMGERSMDETVSQLQQDTRRYAKRQLTWFRADTAMIWCEPERKEEIARMIEEFLQAA
jgi:tRNA dimethylallyltransferase